MKKSRVKTNIVKPTAVELFAGAGGLMLGLEMAGFKSILANEIHKDPCKTLSRNFPDTPIIQGSIANYSGKDLLKVTGQDSNQTHEIDLVAGGPPCQGFSTAGLKNPSDIRNNLIGEFLRIIEELRPKYFLLENVSGLKTMYKGKLFKKVLEKLDSTGYKYHYKILKASNYGVPQMRKRLVFLGAREGAPPDFPKETHEEVKPQKSLHSRKPFTTCEEALSDLPLIDQGEIAAEYDKPPESEYQKYVRNNVTELYNHQASKHRKQTMEYYALIPLGGTVLDIPIEKRKKKQGIQRFPLDGQARTITTEPTDFLHPTLDRIPTIRELARLQSFPDWFEFMGQRTTGNKMRRLGYCSQSQQVGNAVPPLLAKVLGKSIIESLSKQFKKTA